ncbi:MAG: hypothetical protein IKO78_00500 [Bacilli bacterium]|nr:hypothetical protein [Bacilli bacterium]
MDISDKAITNLRIMSGNSTSVYTFGRPKRTNHRDNRMVMSVEVSEGDTYQEIYKFADPTIYDYYPTYSRALVNRAIHKLDPLNRFFTFYVYGGNLPHPNPYQLTEGQMNYFHSVIVPKIGEILSRLPNYSCEHTTQKLETNEFGVSDYIYLGKLMGMYRPRGFDIYLSCNMLCVRALQEGYLNGKKYTPNEVMEIMRLEKPEYESLINGIEIVKSDEKVSKILEHKMGRIYIRY